MLEVTLEDLSRTFGRGNSKKVAVCNLSFSVEPGELFGLLGPNGSGKSTTIRMLTTLLQPSSGDARVGQDSIKQVWEVRKHIGVVFQDPSLDLRLSAMENMDFYAALYRPAWPATERRRVARQLLELLGLADRAQDMVRTYSWGMRRRLEIARALMTDPEVLFLDEPTTGLDPQSRASLWAHLAAMRQTRGMTVMVATHDMEEAARCDRVAVLRQGRLVALGTPAEICRRQECQDLTQAFLSLTGYQVPRERTDGTVLPRGRDATLYRRG